MKNRMYADVVKQIVFENSCDCLYYGYNISYLNKLNLTDEEARKIWEAAKEYLSRLN